MDVSAWKGALLVVAWTAAGNLTWPRPGERPEVEPGAWESGVFWVDPGHSVATSTGSLILGDVFGPTGT